MIPSYAKESRATHTHRPPVSPPPKPKSKLKTKPPFPRCPKIAVVRVVRCRACCAHICTHLTSAGTNDGLQLLACTLCSRSLSFVSFVANEIKPPYFVFFFGETGRVPGLAAIFSSVKPFFKFLMPLPREEINAVKSTNPNTRSRVQQEKQREREREWQNVAAQPPPATTSLAGCC